MSWTVDGNSYPCRKLVTIPSADAALTDVPVKVQIVGDGDMGIGASDCRDFRFTSQMIDLDCSTGPAGYSGLPGLHVRYPAGLFVYDISVDNIGNGVEALGDGEIIIHCNDTIAHTLGNIDSSITDAGIEFSINPGHSDSEGIVHNLLPAEDPTYLNNYIESNTLLNAERESGSVDIALNASAIFWVKIPNISATANTYIYCYYGVPGASAQTDATNVWDSSYMGVWHLKETGTNPAISDSTSKGHNSSSAQWTPTPAQIDGGGNFDGGTTNVIKVGDSSDFSFSTGDFTMSAWLKFTNGTSGVNYVALGRFNGNGDNYWFGKSGKKLFFSANGGALSSVADYNDGNYHYAVAERIYNQLYLYIDNASAVGVDDSSSISPAGNLAIGNFGDYFNIFGWNGGIDEVKISKGIGRSAAWIKFEYYNQKDAAGGLTWGDEEGTPPAPPPSTGNFFLMF